MLSRAEKALTLRGTLKPGKNVEALEAWHGELMRAIAHGFNDDELADARKALGATLDERGRKQSHADNTVLAKKSYATSLTEAPAKIPKNVSRPYAAKAPQSPLTK